MNEFNRLQSLQNLPPIDAARDLDIHQWLTDEGARVLFVRATELPMFDIRLTMGAGSCRDGSQPGAAFLTVSMLNEGTPGLDAQRIAETFESVGATFHTHIGADHATISLRCLSAQAQRETAIDTLARVLGKPDFPEAAIREVKAQCIDVIDARELGPDYRLQRQVYQHLYADHPYGYPRYGNRTGITSLTRDDLLAFHGQHYTAANTAISLVGDLSLEQAQAIAARLSAGLPAGAAPEPILRPAPCEREALHLPADDAEVLVTLVLPGILRDSADYAALTVANDIFGAGTHSRVYNELRTRRGLAYNAGSQLIYAVADGRFVIYWRCGAPYNSASQRRIKEMLEDYVANGPTAAELSQSRHRILSSAALRTATNQAILGQLSTLNAFGLPPTQIKAFHDQVNALTLPQVHQAIRRNLVPYDLVYASIGADTEQIPLPPPVDTAR